MVSQMLAELMLPDQVHNREEDWTIFFLHKGPDEGEPEGEAGLMYVLSLVNKKMDQTAKRYDTELCPTNIQRRCGQGNRYMHASLVSAYL